MPVSGLEKSIFMGWFVVESCINWMSAICGSGASCAKEMLAERAIRLKNLAENRMCAPKIHVTLLDGFFSLVKYEKKFGEVSRFCNKSRFLIKKQHFIKIARLFVRCWRICYRRA